MPKIVMTLLVRNNADIVGANLDFHLAMGVDHVVVTDNRSEDGTRDIVLDYVRRGVVTLIDEPADDYDQSAWVTRMARLAAKEHSADWIINSDVDEFWWPLAGDLRSVFSAVPRGCGAVSAQRTNFLPMRRLSSVFWREMVWRYVVSHNGLGEPLLAKIAHRAAADVTVAEGNHAAISPGLGPLDPTERIVIFHFPYRSAAQYAAKIAKGGPAVANNRKVGPGIFHVWRQHAELQRLGGLEAWYERLPHGDDPQRDELVARGEVVYEARLKEFMEKLEGRSSLAKPGSLAAPSFPKACILVAGMHRSGTSAAARVINLLGADIARDLTPAIAGNNDRGFWEPKAVVAIHDRLLAALGSAWDDPFALPEGWTETDAARDAKRALADELTKDFVGSRACVMKDPRLGRLLPLWLELLDELEIEPVVVVSVRNPLEVAASLRQRDRFPLAKSLLMYLRHTLETELASRGRQRIFVRYDHLLIDWRSFARKLEKMVGPGSLTPLPADADAIDRFLTLDLYHNRATHGTLGTTPDVPAMIAELFDRVSEAADTGEEAALCQACDRMRATLVGAAQLFELFLPHASAVRDEGVPFAPIPRNAADFVSSASFWFPEHLSESLWVEHAPFAFWLIDAHRPLTLVEVGTDRGFSFFAFCQAVHALGLSTRCFAVDTWRGDDLAGAFASVREHNNSRYAAFARLVRATSEEAVSLFADGSIDLLHIDGRHSYEDVRHEFDLWLPKLSRCGVVVFHDTTVRDREFGVHRIWAELRQTYPHFEFLHGRGLGVLAVGEEIGVRLGALFHAGVDEGLVQQIRLAYARLGAGLTELIQRMNQDDLLVRKDADFAAQAGELARVKQELAAERSMLATQRTALAAGRTALAVERTALAVERGAVARLTAASAAQATEIDAMKGSISWRVTRPLRLVANAVRRLARSKR